MENQTAIPDFTVCEENWESIKTFISCSTQLRRTGLGDVEGLDYGAVESVFRLSRVDPDDWPDLFAKIQLIETGLLKQLSENRQNENH